MKRAIFGIAVYVVFVLAACLAVAVFLHWTLALLCYAFLWFLSRRPSLRMFRLVYGRDIGTRVWYETHGIYYIEG